jgi:hypothetical protein
LPPAYLLVLAEIISTFTFLKKMCLVDGQATYPQRAAHFCLMTPSWHHIDKESGEKCLPSSMH